LLHILYHVLVPGLIAWLFYRSNWKWVWLLMAAGILADLDHLFAVPIYDSERCSIGFHFLHTYPAIAVYALLLFIPKVRVLAIGLLVHMVLDYIDCLV
jgi:hypothetical protein